MNAPADRTMQTYVQWDVGNWSRALSFWLDTAGPGRLVDAEVLELGSRDGGLSLWLADQGAGRVVCSDLNGPAESARALHDRAGVGARIDYAAIDATSIGRPGSFEVVAFKSVLGGIGGVGGAHAQGQAIRSIYEALKPGGALLFAENLSASAAHAYLRRRFVRWSDHWRYVSEPEVRGFLADFSHVELTTFGFAAALGRSESQRRALARIDRAGLDRVVPSRWNYVIAGVAKK